MNTPTHTSPRSMVLITGINVLIAAKPGEMEMGESPGFVIEDAIVKSLIAVDYFRERKHDFLWGGTNKHLGLHLSFDQ